MKKEEIQSALEEVNQQIEVFKQKHSGIESRDFTAEIIAVKKKQTAADQQLKEIEQTEKEGGYNAKEHELHDVDKRDHKKGELRDIIEKHEREVQDLVKLQKEFESLLAEKEKLTSMLTSPPVQSSMTGNVDKPTPFGKTVPIPINHFESLTKAAKWNEWNTNFCKDNDLKSVVDDKNSKLTYSSKDSKETIEVTKERVTAKIDQSSDVKKVLPAMVDLYLKSIEGKNVTNHTIASNKPEIKDQLEKVLATKLQELGIQGVKINGKELDDIAPKSTHHI